MKNLFYLLIVKFLFITMSYSQNILSLDYNGGDSLKINMINEEAVGGFQLQIDGINILSVTGGSAADNNFDISSNDSTLIGFSFTGSIPPGNGHMMTVFFDPVYVSSTPCLSDGFETTSQGNQLNNCTLADVSGVELPLELGECAAGCFDNTACNYLTNQDCISPTIYYQDADADELGNPDVSQSSCEPIEGYVTDNTDDDDSCGGSVGSDGSCCNSEIFDECGICDGDNSTCSDCAGVPNGDAILDECGVCNGDNSTCSDCAEYPMVMRL